MASSKTLARIRRQAQLAAQLSTDPQLQVLQQAGTQALSDYVLGTRQARGAAQMVQKSARAAVPTTQGYYDAAQQAFQKNLASVGINQSQLTGPAQADTLDFLNRLAGSAAGAKSELTSRANDAAAGLEFQLGNLTNQFASQRTKINQQIADVAGQRGKTAESTLLQLLNQQAGRDVTLRGQNLSHEDRQAAQNALGQYRSESLDIRRQSASQKKGHGGLTAKQVQSNTSKAQAQVNEALTWLKRGAPVDQLLSGASVPHQQDYTDAQGNKKTRFTTIKVPKVDQLYLQAAHDLERFQALQAGTVHKLRAAGIHAETIGPLSKPRRGSAPRNFGERPT